jgi:hypothetical protein
MEEPDASAERVFEAVVPEDRLKSVAALPVSGMALLPALPVTLVFAVVLAADFTVLFTVLWVDLAIAFVAGSIVPADGAGPFLMILTSLAAADCD